jgi:hypothetical protein
MRHPGVPIPIGFSQLARAKFLPGLLKIDLVDNRSIARNANIHLVESTNRPPLSKP